jgi:predicted HD phosphohydrolase
LLLARGHERYAGEPVSQMAHALGTAWLAWQAKASQPLIAAAFLHDCGHLLSGLPGTPSAQGVDDAHELLASSVLSAWLNPAVTEPIRLHVAAKRALVCDSNYSAHLSDDSKRSLVLQGGPFNAEQLDAFHTEPYSQNALRLRSWDDAAKSPAMQCLSFDAAWDCVMASTHVSV